MKQIAYEYKNCPIPGGGFVTGLLFEQAQERMYARTDIGGLYRRDFGRRCWIPLNDDVTSEELAPTYPLSIAVDATHPGYLYAVCGTRRGEHGYLMVSYDAGENFVLKPLPCQVHGNMPGRSTGERLCCEDGVLYFASQSAGLWRSQDEGENWRQLFVKDCSEPAGNPAQGRAGQENVGNAVPEQTKQERAKNLPAPEQNLTFLWKKDDMLIVGCNGAANRVSENMRGEVLYISYDAGEHFKKLPVPRSAGGFDGIAGFVPQHCCQDGIFLYVTFMETEGRHCAGFDSYSFDTGSCRDGRVWRYRIFEEPPLPESDGWKNAVPEILAEDVTPVDERLLTDGFSEEAKKVLGGLLPPKEQADTRTRLLSGGISGIDYCKGLLLCSTGSVKGADAVFASMDAGEHWLPVLCGLAVGRFSPGEVSYMKPEYNGGGSILHWLSDIKINPHHPDEAYVTTGTGIFRCEGLDAVRRWLSAEKKGMACGRFPEGEPGAPWADRLLACCPDCEGLEETVHLNVYSLPAGSVRVVDIVGDLGGFSFSDPYRQCENSFADEKGDRYITCLNADFPEQYPNMLVTGARGNWSGRTKGGALLSYDQGRHFMHLPYPEGISQKLDALVEGIKRPNTDAGYVAVTADGRRVLWAVAGRGGFASDCVVYMDIVPRADIGENGQEPDGLGLPGKEQEKRAAVGAKGRKWYASRFFEREGKPLAQPVFVHPYADRVSPKRMYAFADGGRIFLSSDCGECFYETKAPENFPKTLFSHWSVNCQVTVDYTDEGVLYLAVQESGLYRLRLLDKAGQFGRENLTERFGQQANAEPHWEMECLTLPGDYARCVGLGCGRQIYGRSQRDGENMEHAIACDEKTIYMVGRMDGTYGFYRSFDNAATWERINDEGQMFGEIRAICGDRREAGVFYLASGSRGLLCGRPKF